ncbi:hypothetical protein scyTo_0027374, partial [Scyliorhinus torazame]|nr:hypothetical protein [Scyliorhinus torazame]
MVCRVYGSDSLEALHAHAGASRHLPEEDWREVSVDLHHCKLCSYSTQLKANFQLHLKTDKHSQKYQLVAHLRLGAPGSELQLAALNPANPVHLRCNLCHFETNSRDKLRLHVAGHCHQENLKVYK